MEISSAPFVEVKANYETIGFGEGISGRYKVGGIKQKEKVGIDEGDGISCEGACVGRHWYFAEIVRLCCRIAVTVFATSITRMKDQEDGVKYT